MTATSRSAPPRIAPPAQTRIASLLAWLGQSDRRAVAFLTLFSLLAFLPGVFGIPPVDREEARVAQATKQMLESGNFVDQRFQNEVQYAKPVGVEWTQALAVTIAQAAGVRSARTHIWVYRIPSVFGALGGVLLTYWAALAFMSRRGAMMAAVMLASAILLGIEARLAKPEALLLFDCIAAMGAMARAYLVVPPARTPASGPPQSEATQASVQENTRATTQGWTTAAIFWTALAAGILAKGALIVMLLALPALTLAACDRSVRWMARLKPFPGLLWMLLLLAPWFATAFFTSGGDLTPGPLLSGFARDVATRLVGSEDVHRGWPGFYFLLFWVMFFPGSVFAGFALPFIWRTRREPAVRFLLAWIVPSWVVFELAVTKLPSYVLPLYPAIALLFALAIERDALSRKAWLVRHTVWWFVVPSCAVLFGVGAAIVIGRQFAIAAWPFAGCVIALSFLTWRLYEQDGGERSLLRAGAVSILLAATFYGILVPSLGTFFPSVALARAMNDSGCRDPLAASVGFHEPSLVFLAGTPTVLTSAVEAAEFLGGGACRFVFIDTRYERSFAQRADAIGLRYASGPRLEAFNFGAGRSITIAVYSSDIAP